MNQSYSLSTSSELELEPMHDDSGSDSLSPLNARTATIVVLALSLMLVLGEAVRRKMVEAAERKEAVEHCRQIIIGLRLYSPDVNGIYPYWIKDDPIKIIGQNKFGPIYASHDPESSNETFRELFRAGACTDEMIFGCPQSPFQPDLNVGTAPSYREAVQKGENH